MMDDVKVSHIVEEETTCPAQEIAINSRGSTTLEAPLSRTIVWELGVCMVQVRYHDKPSNNCSFSLR